VINKIRFLGVELSQKSLYFIVCLILTALFNLLLLINEVKLSLLIPVIFIAFLLFFTLKKYYLHYFIISLGIVWYIQFDYRIQIVTILSILMIFLFVTFKDTEIFNNFMYPSHVKLISILLVLQIFGSSLISRFSSAQTLIYAFVFLVFILVSYVIFRSVKSIDSINNLIDLFVKVVIISTIIDFFDIAVTGYLRSTGIMGYAIMDFSIIVLLILIFKYYLLGKANYYVHISTFFTVLLIIFHQSRFAWLGFTLSFSYGLIITFKYFPHVKKYMKKRAFTYILIALLFVGLIFVFGYNDIILSRVSQINFDFFQGTPEEGQYLSNSLESRLLIWITAYNTFISQPFFGVGYFMFPIISEQYNILPSFLFKLYVENLDAHTTYFNFLVETGIFGFGLFASYLIIMFRISLKSIKMAVSDEEKTLSIIINIFCFFVIVHSLYAGAFTFGLNAFHMWFMFALNLSNYIILKKNLAKEHNK
jgi:O-antigen ligase